MIANIPAVIAAHLESWATIPVAWPDRPIDRPDPPAPWLLAEIIGADSTQESVGAPGHNLHLATAAVWVHVFVPMPGEPTAWTLACEIASLFRGQILGADGDIRIGNIGISGSGSSDLGVWWRRTVTIEIDTYDEG